MIYLGLIPAIAYLDKRLKDGIEVQDADDLPQSAWHDRINLTRAHNKGMTLNFMEDKPDTVLKVQLAETALLALWYLPTLFKKGQFLKKLGGALMLGGALGNLYDRFKRGFVVDFIQFKLKPLNKIIINLADICIAVGAVFSMLHILFGSSKK